MISFSLYSKDSRGSGLNLVRYSTHHYPFSRGEFVQLSDTMNNIKNKTYANIIVFLLIIICLGYFGNIIMVEYVKSLSLEMISRKDKISMHEKRNKKIEEVRNNYGNIQKEMNVVSGALAKYEEPYKLIEKLDDIAAKNNVKLEKLPTDKKEEPVSADLVARRFNIKATGEFDNIINFLINLDNFDYYLNIDRIMMSSYDSEKEIKEEDFSSGITLNAEIKAYFKKKK